MLRRWLRSEPAVAKEMGTPEAAPADAWRFGPADAAITAGLLAATVAVSAPIALRFRAEAKRYDEQRAASIQRTRQLKGALKYLEARRAAASRLRLAVNRYVGHVEARGVVPWTTTVTELSSRRPDGLWSTELRGDRTRFEVRVAAERPDLVQQYVENLRGSQYVDIASPPLGLVSSRRGRIIGRMMGE